MEFAHAARNGLDPRFELRRDMVPGIAPMAIQAESEGKHPAALSAWQPGIEHRGFAGRGDETLEKESLAGRETSQVFAQRRDIIEPACAVAADVWLRDERKCQARAAQQLPGPLEVGEERATAGAANDCHALRNMPPLGPCHIKQIGTLRFAPDCPSRVARIGDDGQSQRPVLRRKPDPARDQTKIEESQRDAIVRSRLAEVAASEFRCSPARILMEVEHLSTQKSDRQHHASEEWPRPPTGATVESVAEEDRNTEDERQIKCGNDETRRDEAGERHACPTAGNEGDEHHARHHAAERHDPKEIALEHGGKSADVVIDRKAPEPGHTPCAGANPVQGDVARHHAGVDAQRHEPHGHDVVHHDIRANNDCEIFMRER